MKRWIIISALLTVLGLGGAIVGCTANEATKSSKNGYAYTAAESPTIDTEQVTACGQDCGNCLGENIGCGLIYTGACATQCTDTCNNLLVACEDDLLSEESY